MHNQQGVIGSTDGMPVISPHELTVFNDTRNRICPIGLFAELNLFGTNRQHGSP